MDTMKRQPTEWEEVSANDMSQYMLDINPLSLISFANTSSHSVDCLFIMSMVSFAVQTLLSLMKRFFTLCPFTAHERSVLPCHGALQGSLPILKQLLSHLQPGQTGVSENSIGVPLQVPRAFHWGPVLPQR